MTTRSEDVLAIGPCHAHEAADVEALVASAGLEAGGSTGTGETLVAREGGRLAGTVGLEAYAEAGLLRSLAVAPDHRGAGLGTRLCEAVIGRAAERGLRRLFLLTFEAPFFRRLGFEECERASVPADLGASSPAPGRRLRERDLHDARAGGRRGPAGALPREPLLSGADRSTGVACG